MKIRLSVKIKVALGFAVIGIVLTLSIGQAVHNISLSRFKEQYTGTAYNAAQMAAAIAYGLDFENYLRYGTDEAYYRAYRLLYDLKIGHGLQFLYIIKPNDSLSGGVYIFDVLSDSADPSLISDLGDEIGADDIYFDIFMEVFNSGAAQMGIITDTEDFGHLATAYAPVFGADGRVTAVAGADISMEVIFGTVRAHTLRIALAAIIIIVLCMVILMAVIQKLFLGPVSDLSEHMGSFVAGNELPRDFKKLSTGDELQAMADSFNEMLGAIRNYTAERVAAAEERKRLATEMDVARRIQKSLLPSVFAPSALMPSDGKDFNAGFDIYAIMEPAKEVGGDFYDFFLINNDGGGKLAVVIADVSGKGVGAALFMAIAKTLIKTAAESGKSPSEVFETVNRVLCENNKENMFVTAFLGYVDFVAGTLTFASAGHSPPLIKRLGGTYAFLNIEPCFIIGGMADISYAEHEISLGLGDELFLYTDGITEAMDKDGTEFGEERLLRVLNLGLNLPLADFMALIKQDIDGFVKDAPQADDITMLALRLNAVT